MALASGTRLGSYEILAPLGAGGMGEVYRAEDTRQGEATGQARVIVNRRRITKLHEEGLSWAKIAERLGVGEGTVYRTAMESGKIPVSSAPTDSFFAAAD